MKHIYIVILIILFGCNANQKIETTSSMNFETEVPHYFKVGKQGTFNSVDTKPEDIDNFFNHLENNPIDKIAIYFHGGMNSEEKGIETAERLKVVFDEAGAQPVSFIWRTGFLTTLMENFEEIDKSKVARKIIKIISAVMGDKFNLEVDKDMLDSNYTDLDFDRELEKEEPFANYLDGGEALNELIRSFNQEEFENELEIIYQNEIEKEGLLELIDQEGIPSAFDKSKFKSDDLGPEGLGLFIAKSLVKVSVCMVKRHAAGTDHDFFPTLQEELFRVFLIGDLGGWTWTQIKDKAMEMWRSNDTRIGDERTVGRYFLDKLSKYYSQTNAEITLVGTSAGSIPVAELLVANSNLEEQIKFKNIVLLAPAITIDKFHNDIYSRANDYENFRMFTMKDSLEKADNVIKVYRRSLLYLVAGLFENNKVCEEYSILGLQRHLSGESPYDSEEERIVTDFMRSNSHMINSITASDADPGFQSGATWHSAFSADSLTLLSLKEIIQGNN